jgi:hypothetical protein
VAGGMDGMSEVPVYGNSEEELREAGIRMAESAIRIHRRRKKSLVRRNDDLVTVLLSLGIMKRASPGYHLRRPIAERKHGNGRRTQWRKKSES